MNGKRNGMGMPTPTHIHRHLQRTILGNYQKKTSWREAQKLQFGQAVEGPGGKEIEPDISYWNVVDYKEGAEDVTLDELLLVIEIVHSKDNWQYSYDRIFDAFAFKPTILEGFIYNYEAGEWWRFRRQPNGSVVEEEGKDYSGVLGLYLHTLTKM